MVSWLDKFRPKSGAETPDEVRDKVVARLGVMEGHRLMTTIEELLGTTWRTFDGVWKAPDAAGVAELAKQVSALQGAVQVLQKRYSDHS